MSFAALGTSAEVSVVDPAALGTAERILRARLDELDRACSRFRADSELADLHAHAGRPRRVSPLLLAAVQAGLRVARLTDGAVDPTVGPSVEALGYDRDLAEVPDPDPDPDDDVAPRPAAGWWRVCVDPAAGTVLLPRGVRLDLGSSAKAYAADLVAQEVARATGTGVLVNLGGDLAVGGAAPGDGWRVRICDRHDDPADLPAPVVTVGSGGLATSSTTRRTWRRGGRTRHHIVDPRTGDNPTGPWRTVSVAAATCLDANAASTAAVVLGDDAPAWLAAHDLPARLVRHDGAVQHVAGWPPEEP